MITNYYRPKSLQEALTLLSQPNTRPLGGGTVLSQLKNETFKVVDLQDIGLGDSKQTGNFLEIGATTTLQQLLESSLSAEALKKTIELEAPLNIRNMGTVAGTLLACDGRSPFGVTMLALDARCWFSGGEPATIDLGDLLLLRDDSLRNRLITKIVIPITVKIAFASVSRTPGDKPLICTATAQWPSGRTRLALGGWGKIPTLAMDGNESSGLKAAARNACMDSGDEWASAEYRVEMADILVARCLEAMGS